MSERELLSNMALVSTVLFSIIAVFHVGGLPAVLVAATFLHLGIQRIERRRTPMATRRTGPRR